MVIESPQPEPGPRWATIVVTVLLLLVSLARWRVLDVPLERDEGEYAYAGQLILDGTPPYQQAYNMKFPGMYYAYAGILAVLGQTPRAIHTGLWLANLASILFVFGIGRRLAGHLAGVAAAIAYATLSLDLGTLGLWTHATQFVVLFSTAGFFVLGLPSSNRAFRLLGGGALLGTAVLMKQQAIVFVVLACGEALLPSAPPAPMQTRLSRAAILLAGAALPLALVVVVLSRYDLIERFFFWTVTYARHYGDQATWMGVVYAFGEGVQDALGRTWPLWATGLCGLLVAWRARLPMRPRLWLILYFAASFVGICPGWYFRPHYFVLMQPPVALLVGLLVARLVDWIASSSGVPRWARIGIPTLLASVLLGHHAYAERELFTETPDQLNFICYPAHTFRETARVAEYIKATTAPTDRIGILGSEPHVFFLSGRRSASGYIYTYPLVEVQPFASRMQREMIDELLAARPTMMVFMRIPASWGFRRDSDRLILRWSLGYLSKCYQLDGAIDMTQPEGRRTFWGPQAASQNLPRSYAIMVYRRTGDSTCTVSPDADDLPLVPMPAR